MSAHIPHEANSEQTFSRAGNLTDPNMNPHYLATMTRVGINKSTFKPPVEATQARYYAKFSVGGKLPEEDEEEGTTLAPAPACAPAPAPAPAPATPQSPARSPRRSTRLSPQKS